MALTNFIQNIWSSTLLDETRKHSVGVNNCNRDYEGEIKSAGDTLYINGIASINTFAYDKNTDFEDSAQTLESLTTKLEITQARAFNFLVDDIDRIQSTPKLMKQVIRQAAAALADRADRYIYGLYSQVEEAQTIESTAITADNVIDALGEVAVKLQRGGICQSDDAPTLEVPPIVAGVIMKAMAKTGNSRIPMNMSGYIGDFMGFKVYVSTNLYVTSGDEGIFYKCFARTKRAITFADQILNIEAYRVPNRFADGVRGLHTYGAKIVYPKDMVLWNVNIGA